MESFNFLESFRAEFKTKLPRVFYTPPLNKETAPKRT
jgi:hypothetical protein